MSWKLVGAAAMALAVAACGTNPEERTTGGAAAGAATGAGIGALGGPVGALAGAAIGAGAGAVTGAATSPSEVNLGAPPWDNPQARVPGVTDDNGSSRQYISSRQYRSSGQHGSRSVREAQRALQQRGFNPGPVDGMMGPQTASAVENFQRANNMQPTGHLNNQVLQALNVNQAGSSTTSNMGSGSTSSAGTTGNSSNNTTGMGMSNPGTTSGGSNTTSTGPGGTSGVGSGNQPGTGGTSQTR